MSTATTTSHNTGQHTTSRTTTQPTNTPTSQLERSAAQRLRTTMAAVRPGGRTGTTRGQDRHDQGARFAPEIAGGKFRQKSFAPEAGFARFIGRWIRRRPVNGASAVSRFDLHSEILGRFSAASSSA